MAYHVIKRVKGRAYLYMQESYRVGAHVKTRSVFVGAVNPETGELLSKDKKDSCFKNSGFVNEYREEVRDRIVIAGDPRESKKQTEINRNNVQDKTERSISPFLQESLRRQTGDQFSRLSIKIDCEKFAISQYSLEQDEQANRERLKKLDILPGKIPLVSLEYGNRLRIFERKISGVFVVTVPRNSKGNREHLRREYRRALSLASIEVIRRERKDLFSVLALEFDSSFRESQKLLDDYIMATNEYNKLPKAIALKYFGLLAPIAGGKLQPSKIGIPEYGTRKIWQDEAGGLMADIQRRGWNNVYSESISEANKARRSQRYIVEDKKIWGRKERKALKRAELRVRLNEEKGEKLKTLRRIFGFK